MKKRPLALLLAGLLLAGCDLWDPGLVMAAHDPAFPNAPPKARPKSQAFTPQQHGYDHPLYRYPPRPDPNAPVRDPEVPARVLKEVAPEYTPTARHARITGIVILELVIDTDGNVSAVRLLKPLPFGLDEKAVEAVRQWRFAPAKQGGKPVPSFRNVTVRFRLPSASP